MDCYVGLSNLAYKGSQQDSAHELTGKLRSSASTAQTLPVQKSDASQDCLEYCGSVDLHP